ncbi:hypothetical protein SK128_011002, partial [Halocaridina rubra]
MEDGLRSNLSHQELIDHQEGSDDGVIVVPQQNSNRNEDDATTVKITKRQIITVAILCFVNLINYMDRYTVA